MSKYKFFVLTGSGISAESGIPTFRDNDGYWNSYKIEDVATVEAIENDPDKVFQFYNERRQELKSKVPNLAHSYLALMEEKYGDDFVIVTQNVDDLHEKAGNRNVIHIHGNLNEAICPSCDSVQVVDIAFKPYELKCKCCSDTLRPNIVLFGEVPKRLPEVYQLLAECTHFIAIGTSDSVYPANEFLQYARDYGNLVEAITINPATSNFTPIADLYDTHIVLDATRGVPYFFRRF